jgi:GntR family transcriptional regulator
MKKTEAEPFLSRKDVVPLHHQLFVVLRDQILRGLYAPGAPIPNEMRLGELFGVSRITVRRAVADLESQGLLEKRHGRGTFVRMDLPPQRPAATLGFVVSLRKQQRNTQVTVLELDIATAPPVIALQLELSATDRAIHAVRLRSANGRPLMVTDAWVPERVGVRITRSRLSRHGLYELLMQEGIRFGRVVQEISAEPADPRLAQLLQVTPGSPLLRMHRILYDTEGRAVQHITIHFTPERSRILMDVNIKSINTLGAGQITHDV